MTSAQARIASAMRHHPRRTKGVFILFVVLAILGIIFSIGWFAPGKIGFIKYLMKTEGHKCGNDENAVSQEFNADKECVTICNPKHEVTKDENDKDVCTKIPDTDCVVGEFGACSFVNNKCIKSRTIETEPTGDGTACPSLSEDCDQSECQVQQPQPQPNNAATYTQHLKTRFYGGKTETHADGPGTLMPGETSLSESKILCTNDLGCLGIQQTCTREQYESPNYPDSCSQEYRRWVVENEETTPEDRQATIGGGSYSVVYLKD